MIGNLDTTRLLYSGNDRRKKEKSSKEDREIENEETEKKKIKYCSVESSGSWEGSRINSIGSMLVYVVVVSILWLADLVCDVPKWFSSSLFSL